MKIINSEFSSYIVLIILIFNINIIQINNQETNKEEDIYSLKKPKYYVNQVCSYNHQNFTIAKNDTINCTCKCGYKSLKGENEIKFGKNSIQCNYEQKRGSIVFFCAFYFLFGFEHLYLERYLTFFIYFIIYLGTILGNCYFVIASNFKKKENDFLKKFELAFRLMPFICLIMWIINLILVLTKYYKDGNGEDIYWDFMKVIFFNDDNNCELK